MKFLQKLHFTALTALVAVLLMLVAQPAMAQKRGGTLKYIVPASDFPSMDGHRETTFAIIHPVAPFYSLLMRLDPTDPNGKKLAGDLAESFTVSKDKKTYTFKIRSGVKFHDGTPLKAKDVVASYEKMMNPPEGVLSPRKAFFLMVDSVSAPNDTTVVFKLSFPTGAFLPAVSMPYNFIYSADQLKKDIHWYEKNENGSGPFKMKEYIPGDKIVGVRDENFYVKGRPYLDGFEASFADKSNVIVQAMKGARIHSMFRGFSPDEVEDIVKERGNGVVVKEAAWNCVLLVAINHNKEPFSNQKFRRALNLGIDRWGGSEYLSKIAIVKTVGGVVFPHDDLAPSKAQLETLEGYWPDINKSRAKARELLKEIGIPEGFKFVLKNRSTDQPYKFVATWLIDQWRQIGLNVEQQVLPTSAFYAAQRSEPPDRAFDVIMDFNCQSIVNPTLDVSIYTSYDNAPSNNSKYIDREMDKLYEAQLKEGDDDKQKAILWDYQKRQSDQASYLITLWWHRAIVHDAKMKGWYVTPSHYLNMQLETVWLDQ